MSGMDELPHDDTGRITSSYEPTPLEVEVARQAICREFGNNGTDGYYIRILKAVAAARASATPADVGELVERLLRERKVRLGDIVAVRALLEDVGADAGEAAAILTAQATALERVVRERDEARADVARKERPIVEYGRELYDAVQMWWHGGEIPDPADMQEYIARSSLEIDREKARAESAEAKLAEARKVIERVAMNEVGSTAHYIAVCDARRWIEETK
jgi:hypothetical protein